MILGTAEHEVGACLADLCAVHHEPEMGGFQMFPAGFQTMVHRLLQTNPMTVKTLLDTVLHFLTELMHVVSPLISTSTSVRLVMLGVLLSCFRRFFG